MREFVPARLSLQRLPPSTNNGFFDSARSSPSLAISSSPGEVSTGSKRGAVAAVTRSLSTSFGSAITTGPGLPLLAV